MKLNNTNNFFSEIKEIPAILDQKTYPSLNGLRAISILMVIIYHFLLGYAPAFLALFYIGPLGVNIFFVISGFLITTLCIKEKIIDGNLSLKSFYIRRALRILPVAYLYIIVVIVLSYVFKLHIASINIIASILFLANISYFQKTAYTWNVGHYWSLSVEEQFYILFPVFIKKKFSAFVALLMLVCFVVPLFVYLKSVIPALNVEILSAALRYLVKFQGIAIGCLFSVLLFKGYLNFGKFKLVVSLVSIFMIFFLHFEAGYSVEACFTNLVISIFTGLIVVNCIQPQNNLLFKFLNLKVLNFIGILSYSIYIWQQLFLSNDDKFVFSKFPLNLVFIMIIPCLSYFYYEKFFLKLKKRFVKIKA